MPESASEKTTIVCPPTRWYFRRLGLMAALFAGLGLFFLYDGAIGYPHANFHADLFDAYDAGKNGDDLDTLLNGNPAVASDASKRAEIEAAHASGAKGGSWAAFAAARHLAEARPERHSPDAIRQQFLFAGVMAVLLAGTAVVALIHRNRSLKAGPDWLETGGGRRIRFSEISSIDFSKWDRGIARLEIADANARNRRIRIDDYKFSGASKILNRIRLVRPEIQTGGWPAFDEAEAEV